MRNLEIRQLKKSAWTGTQKNRYMKSESFEQHEVKNSKCSQSCLQIVTAVYLGRRAHTYTHTRKTHKQSYHDLIYRTIFVHFCTLRIIWLRQFSLALAPTSWEAMIPRMLIHRQWFLCVCPPLVRVTITYQGLVVLAIGAMASTTATTTPMTGNQVFPKLEVSAWYIIYSNGKSRGNFRLADGTTWPKVTPNLLKANGWTFLV